MRFAMSIVALRRITKLFRAGRWFRQRHSSSRLLEPRNSGKIAGSFTSTWRPCEVALNEALALTYPLGSFIPKGDHGIDAHGAARGQVSSKQTDHDHYCSGKDNRKGAGDWQVGDQAGG